jgi:hypothetical protein
VVLISDLNRQINSKGLTPMNLCAAVEKLIDCLEKEGRFYDQKDLNPDKIRNRTSLAEEQNRLGWLIVEIERHRAALGTHYIPGAPMDAMQTYWNRFAVHETLNEFEELPDRIGKVSYDLSGVVSQQLEYGFDIEIDPLEKGQYRIYNNVSKQEGVVSNINEAKDFSLKSIDINTWSEYFKDTMETELENLSEYEQENLLNEYINTLKDQITEIVDDRWEDRDEY